MQGAPASLPPKRKQIDDDDDDDDLGDASEARVTSRIIRVKRRRDEPAPNALCSWRSILTHDSAVIL